MIDVANAAGVSAMTVSNVVNGRPHVREETRRRVLDAIDALGYRMNVAAQALRAGRTGLIGLAVPQIDRPYFGQLAAMLTERFAAEGMRLVVEQTGASREGELDAFYFSKLRMYDGLVLSAVGLGQSDVDLLGLGFPIVVIGERISDRHVDHVGMANVEGARAATEHLLARGCRRIVVLGGNVDDTDVSMPTLRTEGYRQALEEAGVPWCEDLMAACDFTMEGGAQAIHLLVESGLEFDGVFGLTDSAAIGALRGLADVGLRCPQDVKVIGFDDVREARFTVPTLSSVNPGHVEMVDAVARLLMHRIQGVTDEHENVIGPFSVVPRGSTGD
jgi:DNA-binding LacI/PurR family transcriptional regulator